VRHQGRCAALAEVLIATTLQNSSERELGTDSSLEEAGFTPPVPRNTMHLRTAFFTSPDSVLKGQQEG